MTAYEPATSPVTTMGTTHSRQNAIVVKKEAYILCEPSDSIWAIHFVNKHLSRNLNDAEVSV
jgi:hypothetical protein